jgi:hypothetical protein
MASRVSVPHLRPPCSQIHTREGLPGDEEKRAPRARFGGCDYTIPGTLKDHIELYDYVIGEDVSGHRGAVRCTEIGTRGGGRREARTAPGSRPTLCIESFGSPGGPTLTRAG